MPERVATGIPRVNGFFRSLRFLRCHRAFPVPIDPTSGVAVLLASMHAEDDASLAFARRLAEALRRAGMKYADVERACGVKASTIADWVRKGSEPGTLSLARVADAVGTSITALLGREDQPPAGRTILSRGVIARILDARTEKELRTILPISPACVVAFDVEPGDEYASAEIRHEYEKLVRDKIKTVSPDLARELDAVAKKIARLRDPSR